MRSPCLCFLLLLLLSIVTTISTASDDTGTGDGDGDGAVVDGGNADSDAAATATEVVASIEIVIPLDDDDDDQEDEGDTEKKFKATAYVYEGEDVGVGAFRFAEEYSSNLEGSQVTKTVRGVAKQLLEELTSKNYTPPRELTHCGKRSCSAGKLWKRAEEMRKADMHDAAGADLIRALLKTGVEIDFVEGCERSLNWALGSVRRQRERERREAIEEAKLEIRRLEEMTATEEAKERKKEYEADWVKFGVKMQESVANSAAADTTTTTTVAPDGTVQDDSVVLDDLTLKVKRTFVEVGPQGGNWNETIQLIKKIPAFDKTVEALLIEARCHEIQGNHKLALSAAGRLIQKAASHEPWINDSPRMMAATLGANAAMELGLSKNALSFYQTVLKFDPEQQRARKQYRGLKKVVKLMDKAEEQIQKGYNKVASVFVDDCLSAMRGLDVDSPLFRSKIQLKQCTILSGMGKYEEALSNCDSAVELRSGNDSVHPNSQKEAHLARAEALLLDMDYDEAVQDFRAAFDLTPDDHEDKRELNHKLQSSIREKEMWNGGMQNNRYNEHTGFPNGMPPQRDHAKILQLPIDLDQRSKDIRCAWLKKQFKLLVRKYHPDKYKGNKKRGSRKFKEVKEAKEILSSNWDC